MVKGCHEIVLEIRPICNNSWTILTRFFCEQNSLKQKLEKVKLIILIRGLGKGFGLIHKRDVLYLTGL